MFFKKEEKKYESKSFDVGKVIVRHTLQDDTIVDSVIYGRVYPYTEDIYKVDDVMFFAEQHIKYLRYDERQCILNDYKSPTKSTYGYVKSAEILERQPYVEVKLVLVK